MRRSVALVCTLAVLYASGIATPACDDPKPVKRDADKSAPPVILSPQPGDVIGSSLTVSGTSGCVVELMINPPGTTFVEITPDPDGTWTYTFNGVSNDVTITACCKNTPPPHSPCANVTGFNFSPTPGIEADRNAIALAARSVKKYKPGDIEVSGTFRFVPADKQTVFVFLENASITDPKVHRKDTKTATLITTAPPEVWKAEFKGVPQGVYLVRAILVGRGIPMQTTSHVISVQP